ncbi:MAG: hypothetical protein QOJ57_1791, partial [Thermoleophilaceae bacterium]|nr:hypothetical protein [Thermoleophilaceae bacterium]
MGAALTHRLAGAALAAAVVLVAWLAPGEAREPHAAPLIAGCTGAERIDFRCYELRYRAMTIARGPRVAIRDLDERARRVGFLRGACHQLMHGIGREAGRRSGLGAFGDGDNSCSSGFFHGVVEAVMRRAGAASLRRNASSVCAPFREREPRGMDHYNCVHGMGHGFMDVHGGDVFRSLAGCARLRSAWERHHCEGGVFMENLTSVSKPRRPPGHLRPERPLYPCTAVAARHKHECYMKQTAYALFVRDNDFGAVFRLCARSPDVAFRPDCYQGLGGDAAIHASKYLTGAAATRNATRALCRLGPGFAARRGCVVGAVTVIVRDGASQATGAVAFCRSLRDPRLRAACSRAHLETVQDLTSGSGARRAATARGRPLRPALICRFAD